MRLLLFKLSKHILSFPRALKRLIVLCVDLLLCVLSIWFAYYLRLGEFVPLSSQNITPIIVSIFIALPIFIFSGLYKAIFRHTGWPALLAVGQATALYGLIFATVFTLVGVPGVPRTIGLIQPLVLLMMIGCSRVVVRIWLGNYYRQTIYGIPKIRALIYGAGRVGRSLMAAFDGDPSTKIFGYLDDDERLRGSILNGKRVYSPRDLTQLTEQFKITHVFLAMPNLKRSERNEILNRIQKERVTVKTISTFFDPDVRPPKPSDILDLDIDDLLGREVVTPNYFLLTKNSSEKIVLVTGAGGSIGSELCRQIIELTPKKLLLVEQSEFALYTIYEELQQRIDRDQSELIPLLASVQDGGRMRNIMATWKPDTVYHAAAYKHVPLVEHNPLEGIRNNVLGTMRTAQAAVENGVSDFVLVSTDKAVRPTNIMGATKRMAEMVVQRISKGEHLTKLSMVRFGNVLGSSGSVVPKFRKQISQGGPITLTHPQVNRFFMSIPEAAQLVIQAGAIATGGDVFVLDMGGSVKIIDLAVRMIELSGLTVRDEANKNGDIEIKITGLRAGEKLFEELLIDGNSTATVHPKISRAVDQHIDNQDFDKNIELMRLATDAGDTEEALRIIKMVVKGYSPAVGILDLLHLEKQS